MREEHTRLDLSQQGNLRKRNCLLQQQLWSSPPKPPPGPCILSTLLLQSSVFALMQPLRQSIPQLLFKLFFFWLISYLKIPSGGNSPARLISALLGSDCAVSSGCFGCHPLGVLGRQVSGAWSGGRPLCEGAARLSAACPHGWISPGLGTDLPGKGWVFAIFYFLFYLNLFCIGNLRTDFYFGEGSVMGRLGPYVAGISLCCFHLCGNLFMATALPAVVLRALSFGHIGGHVT